MIQYRKISAEFSILHIAQIDVRKHLTSNSKLLSLNVFLNWSNIIRKAGCLPQHILLSFDKRKHPIPYSQRITLLLSY